MKTLTTLTAVAALMAGISIASAQNAGGPAPSGSSPSNLNAGAPPSSAEKGQSGSESSGTAMKRSNTSNKIVTGNVHINVPTVHEEINHPGGVVRDSGWGRGGPHSAAEFTDLIKVTIEPDQRQLPI